MPAPNHVGQVPTLKGNPSEPKELPPEHADVLALVKSYVDKTRAPMPWPELLNYIKIAPSESPTLPISQALMRGDTNKRSADIVGDLVDYDLLVRKPQGLVLGDRGEQVLSEWPEEFEDRLKLTGELIDLKDK